MRSRRAEFVIVASVILSISAAALGVALARATARTPGSTRITSR